MCPNRSTYFANTSKESGLHPMGFAPEVQIASSAMTDTARSNDACAMYEAMAVKLAERLDATQSAREAAALSKELREVTKKLALVGRRKQ